MALFPFSTFTPPSVWGGWLPKSGRKTITFGRRIVVQ